jgi:tetratricopeptide (TPR) repeat protein
MKIVLTGIIWLTGLALIAQSPKERVYRAFVSGEMDQWKEAMEDMEVTWERTGDYEDLYLLVESQYGYIAWLIAEKEKRLAREFVKQAEDHLERMLRYDDNWARAHAMLGAIYGFKIGLDPYKAVVFGTRSFDENNRAFELAPDDPQVWMEKANIELYKPTIFGDNSLEAMKMYQKAVQLYERDPMLLKGNWLYLNALIGLASAAIEAEKFDVANATYRKILKIEPGFKWIRDEVYPEFRAKYKY